MAAQKQSFFFDKVLPVSYSVGASVVILGALFKILHWEGANEMLMAGMFTEAFIFLMFALQTFVQPLDNGYAWERVYPELADDYKGELPTRTTSNNLGLTAKMDDMIANARITPEVFNNLGNGLRSLTDTVGKMGQLTDATVATNEYAQNVRAASRSLVDMNKSYGTTVTALSEMSSASLDAKEYRTQFQEVTKKMGALNAVYELELQDTNKHLKAMNAFYGNLTAAMDNMASASKDTQQFKQELSKLTNNLTSLNNIYGSMLTAMKGSNQ